MRLHLSNNSYEGLNSNKVTDMDYNGINSFIGNKIVNILKGDCDESGKLFLLLTLIKLEDQEMSFKKVFKRNDVIRRLVFLLKEEGLIIFDAAEDLNVRDVIIIIDNFINEYNRNMRFF